MFDRLIDFIVDIADQFRFWVILPEYQAGLILRLGRFHREIGPGLHLKWFGFEDEMVANTNITTLILGPQSLFTKDGKELVTNGIIKYSINKPKVYLLEIDDRVDVLRDTSKGAVFEVIKSNLFAELATGVIDLNNECMIRIRKEVNQYGFKIHKVTMTDIGRMKSLRLIQDNYEFEEH